MNKIIVNKIDNNYYLSYKDIKTICYIGKNGLTKDKNEGDLKTPIGIFKLGITFGIHDNVDTKLKYYKIDNDMYFVDDINSDDYNKLVISKEKINGEHLIDYKDLYEYAIEIKSNPNNIKGKGSAIFIHCIGNKKYTLGCIAIPKENMIKLLSLIDNNTLIEIKE